MCDEVEANGLDASSRVTIGDLIGAQELGQNLTMLPPGKAHCPFSGYHGEEEMFLFIEGEGELRSGAGRFNIRMHDVISCLIGGPEVAHQIVNTGAAELRYVALSTVVEVEASEYPESAKALVWGRQARCPRAARHVPR